MGPVFSVGFSKMPDLLINLRQSKSADLLLLVPQFSTKSILAQGTVALFEKGEGSAV